MLAVTPVAVLLCSAPVRCRSEAIHCHSTDTMWRARSIIYCAAFQGYVETDRGGIGPDGIRAMMFDRGYHDDDITDEYGKFFCAVSSFSHHGMRHVYPNRHCTSIAQWRKS